MRTAANGSACGRGGLRALALGCLLVLLSPQLALSQAGVAAAPLRTLHTIDEVFRLSKAETVKGYPVELDAVVTYSDPEWGTLFLYDRTGPTFIDVHGTTVKYAPGTHIRVNAITGTDAGGRPAVTHARIAVLGHAPMPKPQQRTIAEIDTRVAESYRVVTEGVVHQCDEPSARVCFLIFDANKKIWLTVPQPDDPAAESLIGATVRITGVMGRRTDEITHRVSGRIFVNSLEDIQVETPAPPISFTTPPLPLQDLHASDADQRWVRPVHLRGTAIWQSPGLFVLQDKTGTIFVGCSKTVSVHIGTVVDVVGFPSHGEFGLEVADSAVQVSPDQSGAASAAPLEMNAANIVKQSLSGRRVHMKARLIGQSASATEFVYQLDDGGQRFNAVLLRNETTRETVGLTHQSVLELTGIALVQGGTPEWPESLLVLVESPSDIVVVAGGNSWLTPKRALAIVGAVFLCVIAPLVWVKQLRSTVRKQTGIIRARLESEMQAGDKIPAAL